MTKKFDLLVYIGRFQPPHKAHTRTIGEASKYAKEVKVFLGSAFEPRTFKNPWSWKERANMIESCFPADYDIHLSFEPLKNIPEDNEAWANQVKELVGKHYDPSKVGIIGHYKDASSFYLDLFPQWGLVEMENTCGTNATDIREKYFNLPSLDMSWADDLPLEVIRYLKEFKGTPEFLEVFNKLNYDKAHYSR